MYGKLFQPELNEWLKGGVKNVHNKKVFFTTTPKNMH